MTRILIGLVLLLGCFQSNAQQLKELSPAMNAELSRSSEQVRDLFVSADPVALRSAAEEGRLKILGQVKGYTLIRSASPGLEYLLERSALNYVSLSPNTGVPLNDLMVSNNNVLPIHQGISPLNNSLKGDGVIMGVIDTGIELNHPDFLNEDGTTRILRLWDHTFIHDEEHIPEPYGYGTLWTKEEIDAGEAIHEDQAAWFGHGSTVTGTACGNGNALDAYSGVAPNSDMVIVSFDFGTNDFLTRVVHSIEYIFQYADEQGKPCVINTSVGQYYGSHDALDPQALYIDSLLEAQAGRLIVAAVGNSNSLDPYHLHVELEEDTAFTWFEAESSLSVGGSGVFFELWADTSEFSVLEFKMGADRRTGTVEARGTSPYVHYSEAVGQILAQPILNDSSDVLGIAQYWAQLRGAQVQLQVFISAPDSSQYDFRFQTKGTGSYDVWTTSSFGTSDMIQEDQLPIESEFPEIQHYQAPDRDIHMVDSWTCSDKVVTVANYMNRVDYPNYSGGTTTIEGTQGDISITSSAGPTRDGRQKPDLAATGSVTLSSGNFPMLEYLIANEPFKVAPGGMHFRNGGSSMASPVVAGIAALYLQQCPLATWSDFKQAVNSTTAVDGYTGAVPNGYWGMGKVNGFGALASDALMVEVVQDGDSLHASGGFAYQWYQDAVPIFGATASSLNLQGMGTYQVEVFNEAGCSVLSEEVLVTNLDEHTGILLEIQPNPVSDHFLVKGLKENTVLEVVDSYGRTVLIKSLRPEAPLVDVSDLKSGLYFCRFGEKEGALTLKLVKD